MKIFTLLLCIFCFTVVQNVTATEKFPQDESFEKKSTFKQRRHQKDSLKIIGCLHRLLENGYTPSDYKLFINNTYYGAYFPVNGRSLSSIPCSDPENKLAKKVNNLIILDQAFREYWWPDSGCIDWEKIATIDSVNQRELLKMVKKYGKLPGIKELGEKAMHNMIILLRHINKFAFTELCFLLIEQAKNGDFPPERIAGVIDYYWIREEPVFFDSVYFTPVQCYGTICFSLEEGKCIFVPLEDREETERLRKEIGMPPLEEEFKKNPDMMEDDELFWSKYTRQIKKKK